MNNADMPAMPQPIVIDENGEIIAIYDADCTNSGLTKREHFAAMAMQGFITAGHANMPSADEIASLSIEYANALLKALES